MEETYRRHLRRLSDAQLEREHNERLVARDVPALVAILNELYDRERGTSWDRKTSTGRRLRLVR